MKGTVVAAFGRQYQVQLEDASVVLCFPRAKKSEVACGDEVEITMTAPDQGVIDALLPRRTLLYRADAYKQKLIAANVSQVLIVTATEPSFSEELVTRCLCAAYSQEIPAVIILNKSDLTEALPRARALLAPFAALGYEVLELSAQEGAEALRAKLVGHTSLLVGQSGMGKSTLTNAMIPEARAATREISEALDTGKHTTTHARMYQLAEGGRMIDSPGLQAFGLAHLSQGELESCFPEISALFGQCRFRDCSHEHEPDCAVRAALADGRVSSARYATLLKLLDEHERSLKKY